MLKCLRELNLRGRGSEAADAVVRRQINNEDSMLRL